MTCCSATSSTLQSLVHNVKTDRSGESPKCCSRRKRHCGRVMVTFSRLTICPVRWDLNGCYAGLGLEQVVVVLPFHTTTTLASSFGLFSSPPFPPAGPLALHFPNRPLSQLFFYYTHTPPAVMSVAQWDNEYARLARAASQMRTTGIVKSAADIRSLSVGLQQLETDLSRLTNISPSEIQRRRRLIQHLQQTTVDSGNSGLVGHDYLGLGGTGTGGGLQPQQQQQQQSHMTTAIHQQDAMIDQLAVGVSRLKHQSLAIGEEANMHVNLMTDMESGLDAAHQGLLSETRRAATLREDQNIWRLQLIVAALAVLLILLIFMGLSP
jgi:hypothetical protein